MAKHVKQPQMVLHRLDATVRTKSSGVTINSLFPQHGIDLNSLDELIVFREDGVEHVLRYITRGITEDS